MNNIERFNEIKAAHPTWSDEQIWTAISLEMEADKTITEKGSNIDRNDPEIFQEIIRRAGEWLEAVLPKIFNKVKELFAQLLNRLAKWAKDIWPSVMDFVKNWFRTSGPMLR